VIDQQDSAEASVNISPFSYQEVRMQVKSMLPVPIEFDDDDNLIELGLDSLKIMRIVSKWRRAGSLVTFAELIEAPRLREWWSLLQKNNIEPSVVSEVATEIEAHGDVNEPFPLTDVQHAYWIGRRDDQPLGGVGCHAYLEIDGKGVEPQRLESAWIQLLTHHSMLRARFLANGQQEIVDTLLRKALLVHDLRLYPESELTLELKRIRNRLSHRRLPVEKGEVAGLELSLLPGGYTRLHFDIDLLVADVQSLQIIIRDLAAAYGRGCSPAAPINWSFSKYLKQEVRRRSLDKKRAGQYWNQCLLTLPTAPGLPLKERPEAIRSPVFKRRSYIVKSTDWNILQKRSAAHQVTPAMVLLTAYAEVLDRWSTKSQFLINIPLFDRQTGDAGIEDVVADFSNLLLLAVDCSFPQSFLERVRGVQTQFHKDVANAAYSGVQVQRDMARVRQGERTFAPVVFACNLGTPLINAECRETLGKLSYMISQTPQVWIDFQVYEMDDGLLLAWDAVDALFPDGLIDQMFTAYTQFIEWLVTNNNDWQSSLNVLPAAQQQIRDMDVELSIPQSTQCLHTSFFDFAATNPQQTALIDSHSDTHLSYGEVAKYALQVAALLKEHGVMQGDPVAVTLPRGIEQIAAVFGILALGACYVPVSIEQPSVRRDHIHKKAAIRHVLTNHEQGQTKDWPTDAVVLDIANIANTTALAEPVEVSPEHLAYIIFTSGSTGEPKGVEISHCAAWNTIAEINRRYNVSATDRILAVSSLDFDLSVYDIFGLLSVGGSLVLITEETRRDAVHWLKLLNKYQVTIWNSVPVLLDMLLVVAESEQQKTLPLRLSLLSGDWIGLDIPARLHSVAEHCHLVAMGGATEASIWSNFFDVTLPLPAHWTSIPYGRPLANQAYRVVDSKGRDCPDWVAGELWIGGAGVAQGYRGDPKLTAERFVKWNGSRWYRTGDMGRYLPDGNIEFLGREDFQVKIRGHRIELGEIETALKQHPGVRDAVVTAAGDSRGSKHLVGYVVPGQERAVNIYDSESSQNDDITRGYEQFGQDGTVLLDPVKRLEFKIKKPGVREEDTDSQYIKLAKPEMDDALINIYSQRMSYRKFEKERIKLEQFWGILRHLSAIEIPELPFPRYRYGSAGGLYPVQVYLYIKPHRVGRLSEGIYYYNPIDNHLVVISAGAHIDRGIVADGNDDIFDEAAFVIFFIADLDAISPMYGGRSRDFCMIEAGLMTQLLETSCFAHQIGLCQIGVLDFPKIRLMFRLKNSHEYLHCLFGGRVNQPQGWSFLHEASQSMLTASKKSKSGIGIIDELGSFLKQKLPDYMVPSSLIVLDKLPLSPNGKVDRQALPAPEDVELERKKIFVSPRTPTEVSLAHIWAQVLNINHVSIHDNFFELGGDSLLAIQLVYRVRQTLSVELPIGRLFETPSIAELAEYITITLEKEQGGGDSQVQLPEIVLDREHRHLPFPLTDIQQAYWIGRTGDFELGNIATHFYIELESNNLNIETLNVAWRHVIDRHEMLRAIVLPDGQQKILEDVPSYQFEVMDLRKQNKEETDAELNVTRQNMSHQILSSEKWPLFDIRVSHYGDNRVRLHISFDAQMVDAWSFFSLISDWYQFYKGNGDSLVSLDLSFRDYVLAETMLHDSELYLRDKEYWLNKLPSLPPSPELPLAKNPGSLQQPRFKRRSFTLDTEIWRKLKSKAAQNDLTPAGLLIAVYADILSVWSKSPNFTINVTLFNRLPLHPQVNNIVGDFTSLTLLAVDNSGEEKFITRASQLQQQLWQDLGHRYFSGIRVLREIARLRGEFKRSAMPVVFTSALNMESLGRDVSGFNKLGEWVYGISQTPQVWLDHQVYEQDGDLILIWDAVEELFPEGLLDDMFEAYCCFFQRLADEEEAWQETTRQLIPAAQFKKRSEVNATDTPISSEMLHTLFAAQVSEQPDHLAVIFSNHTLSYKELFHRSNNVGHLLREKGTQPNTLVAVVMDKGWEQVVAVLGILQSGAAYLPIDPELPRERLWHLLDDSKVNLILTQSWLEERLEWPENLQCFSVDTMELMDKDARPLDPVQRPEDLAYVIYTSGSTGLPKGVMIDHRGAVNTILDMNKRFGVGPEDRVLALSNLNFDLSVYDIFGTLATGGTIVLPDADKTKDPAHWSELMAQAQVTIWNSVPALMQMLVEYASDRTEVVLQSLRLVLLSGDWIPLDLPDKVKALVEDVQVISLGGATEASIWSNLYPIDEVDPEWKSIPYGRPMTNQRFYVLNEFMEDCPDWVPGQLYISGIGLAQGYWRDEEKTKDSFIVHPRTRERLYRTGDLGRYLPDGNIEFLGREDFQVKISGYRIELGEIEEALKHHPGVKDAVVIVLGESREEKHLVGYVVPNYEKESNLFEFKQVDSAMCASRWESVKSAGQLQASQIPDSVDIEAVLVFMNSVDRLSFVLMCQILHDIGIFSREEERYSIDEMMRQFKIQPRYQTLVLHWLNVLEEEGLLEKNEAGIYLNHHSLNEEMPGLSWEDEFEFSPKLSKQAMELYSFLRHNNSLYIDLLKGEIDPLELFLTEDTFLAAEGLDRFNLTREYYIDLSSEVFSTIMNSFPSDKEVQVLEIGTRAGNLTGTLVSLLPKDRGRYLYADESSFFTDKTRQKLGDISSLEYALLDMNRAPSQQGYEPHSFDMIVADNTLHRAKNIEITLEYVKEMLAPGGLLFLIESTQNSRLMLTTVGFLEDGFSHLEDERKANHLPLISVEKWREIFKKKSFSRVMTFPEYGHAAEVFGQHLIVAQAPETVRVFESANIVDALRRKLPDYMVPTTYLLLDEFPLSANAKVDRKALAKLGKKTEKITKETYVAPSTEIQVKIASVWTEILGCTKVGIHDNFFELGGDSLRAIQCVNLLKELYQVDLSLQDFFEASSVDRLAKNIQLDTLTTEELAEDFEEGMI